MLPVETDFTPIRRYEGSEQNHAVVGRGQASDSPYNRNGRQRERREETPHDEAILSEQAIEQAHLAADATQPAASGPLSALGNWLVQRLEDMSSKS